MYCIQSFIEVCLLPIYFQVLLISSLQSKKVWAIILPIDFLPMYDRINFLNKSWPFVILDLIQNSIFFSKKLPLKTAAHKLCDQNNDYDFWHIDIKILKSLFLLLNEKIQITKFLPKNFFTYFDQTHRVIVIKQ